MKKLFIFIALLLPFRGEVFAQVSINADSSEPDNSAMLDVKSSAKGFLPPRMSHAEVNNIQDPAAGLIVFCTDCGVNGAQALVVFMNGGWNVVGVTCFLPVAPEAGIHIPSYTQITWNWDTVAGATGYKWNTTDDYGSAEDLGSDTTKTETGLTCNTMYERYVWAYSSCGTSASLIMNQATTACSTWTCGNSITISHIAGDVAPVLKTVTYGTVTDIPGEPLKCWITSNLGADHQATAVDDATEASAGWYWQFNRKQGYKHDGSIVTPAWTITSITEDLDWLPANDPCTIELGDGWRIPTYAELNNIDASGNWNDWNGPWNSGLKLHAAGYLHYEDGWLGDRGVRGNYSSSTQSGTSKLWQYHFHSYFSAMVSNDSKAYGFPLRCLQD